MDLIDGVEFCKSFAVCVFLLNGLPHVHIRLSAASHASIFIHCHSVICLLMTLVSLDMLACEEPGGAPATRATENHGLHEVREEESNGILFQARPQEQSGPLRPFSVPW